MRYRYSYYRLYVCICTVGIVYILMTYFLSSQKYILEQSSTNTPIKRFYYLKSNFTSKNNELTNSEKYLTCNFDMQKAPEVDIQMLDLYRQLKFDDPYGGVWEQGWDVSYDIKQWSHKRKLKVFVVPHSHNDPGWLKTFEDYYLQKTQHILNNMVVKLSEDKRRKFIWAEISYFKLWWDEQTEETRETVRQLITDGQLEIVSGGWVMPDEAVSHWMAQLTQLTEGHQWLKRNLGYRPTSSWAIDPFGLSPTMPYLYKNSGLQNVLIQRVHYAVKKYLAKNRNLEFRWRQLWDATGSSEILTHMMPFVSYDIRHSCGPDPNICGEFDFNRLMNKNFKIITTANVAERASILLDQYRKKSQLYKSNVVLAPHGDDFRYTSALEWSDQYNNHQALFDYMNGNDSLNVDIQFGTLTDYFNAVKDDQNIYKFPSLSGDFFTYSDRGQNYWSGYYTSRPFHKRLDRVLMDTLRRTEIISVMSWAHGHQHLVENNFEKRMSEARQWHSLFQHHDGITGTARDYVVIDYSKKMISALTNLAHITQQSVAHLLRNAEGPTLQPESVYLSLDEVRSHHTSIDDKYVLSFSSNEIVRKVVIYNSVPRQRTKVQTLITSTPYVKVTDSIGKLLQSQVSPIWTGSATVSKERYELSFITTVPGFGISTYMIHFVGNNDDLPPSVHLANITLFNIAKPPSDVPGFTNIKTFPSGQEFSITQRPEVSAYFSKSGLLKSLRIGETTTSVNLEFVKYNTRRSGAYLFTPSNPNPDPIYTIDDHVIHLVTGPILSRVFIQLPQVKHSYTLFNSTGSDGLGLHISNQVDISQTYNFELVMRLNTNISSGDEFFTDLNGLNIIKRQKFSKLPTQANYYPLPAVGYIQDAKVRLTVVTGQPLGAASMASGQFEIMQDRRLMQDDDRGLAQGVTDNLLTNHIFMLVLEKKELSWNSSSVNHPAGMISIGGLLASEEILHPLVVMHPHLSTDTNYVYKDHFAPLNFDLPVDLAIANLRVFPTSETSSQSFGIVLHRHAIDTCWNEDLIRLYKLSNNGEINISQLFNFSYDWIINEASLTFNSVGTLLTAPTINLYPHEISAFLFHKP